MAKAQNNDKGNIQISSDVISTIAETAALEIDGVTKGASPAGGMPVFARKAPGKGVKVTVTGDEVTLDMNIAVIFGYRMVEVAENVQTNVKNAVQTMTGLTVKAVNVVVSNLYQEQEVAPKTAKKNKESRSLKQEAAKESGAPETVPSEESKEQA